MKFKWMLLAFSCLFTGTNVISQNVLINVLTRDVGIVKKGGTVFLEVTINNTDPFSSVADYKIKAQISIPAAIASIPDNGHLLPAGWIITSNNGKTINLSNGTDTIPPNKSRTILIAVQGIKIGGPSTIVGQLSFSNGNAPGTVPGLMPGDHPADNFSSSTCKIIR